MKCRTKREVQNPEAVYTRRGQPAMKGTCPVCGTNLFRMGRTEAHASLPKPATDKTITAKRSGKKAARRKARRRGDGKLVVVESPAKARTVGKFLGRNYEVMASIGHVRDLLKSRLSVDVQNDFTPTYRVPKEKNEVVKKIKEAARDAAAVYLATDPDREGEAIAWHLMQAADIPAELVYRVVFHEITQGAVAEAFAHPRGIDMQLVNAQQARRILDRLVGYKISPLLWEKVMSGLSAGRVQSVALRLVVEREREIENFVPEEYWSIEAELAKIETRGQSPRPSFTAKLHRIKGKKFELKNEGEAQEIVDDLQGASYVVTKVDQRERRRNPAPPFTTSTLQQEASRRLRFNAKRTMRVAQQLYEGISLDTQGTVGLITYMRTDSVNVSAAAQGEARAYIGEKFGSDFLPPRPRVYRTKAKRAQEAHEAIRPTSVRREPEAIKGYLTDDQFLLYDLIWKRFVASQMASAIYDTTTVNIVADKQLQIAASALTVTDHQLSAISHKPKYLFRATGSVLKFPGFLRVYEESRDVREPQSNEEDKEDKKPEKELPPLTVKEILDLLQLIPQQHFTQPPPRYSEATLVKALEKHGIGRPSTYAPIISTIQQRRYVEQRQRRLYPTSLGFTVNDLLVEHFPDIMDVGFTAQMEEDLDLIASGEREWVPVLREFYEPFAEAVQQAKQNMQKIVLADEPAGEDCDKCGSPMIIKMGRYGKFIACSNFPACKNTKPFLVKVGVQCPDCGGEMVEKKTRRGRIFYGCANYPQCEFSLWDRPVPEPCLTCGGLRVVAGNNRVKCTQCGQAERERSETEGDL
ncbi:MAG: type I DNA topoisomerase [Anaerolineae bacterium]